jgi:serine phosphatase RsbU (regulator of sigma subunit)
VTEPQRAYLSLIDDIRGAVEAEAGPRSLLDRAAGLLAGRVGCRVREAYTYLLRLAEEQRRDPGRVAADVLAVLEPTATASPDRQLRSAVDEALRARRAGRPPRPAGTPDPDGEVPVALVQRVLDSLPGGHSWVVPVHDPAGELVDYVTRAASPEAVDMADRRGTHLIGMRLRDSYPQLVDGPLWHAYGQVLADGQPRELRPFTFRAARAGVPAQTEYSVRVHRLGGGLLISWTRHDPEARLGERIAQTERLGNLGWGEWDLVTGQTVWSDQLYRIYERDPADGPLDSGESNSMILPEDEPLRLAAGERFANGETVDVMLRVRIGGKVKHLRTVADAIRDTTGRTLKIYGIVQDVTAPETTRARLAEVERELREHRQTLAAEHRLAAQLQQIILPIPQAPIDLPGLRVAVRYLPAERASRVGGDWYHAGPAGDREVVLAVGDVAGHGLLAATTMAQLRHALSALIVTTTTDPAVLLSQLNRLLCASTAQASTATAIVARFDPASRTLTWAQAGHPPPLRTRDGHTVQLPRPHGPLLGADADARYATESITLEQGDLVVLYTDGLVEHRDRSLQEGLAPVIATLDDVSVNQPGQPLAALLSRLHRANPDDDTCIVAARPLSTTDERRPTGPAPVPADGPATAGGPDAGR